MIEKQIAVSTILCQLNKLLTVLPSFTVILWVYKRDIDIFIYNFWSKYDSLKFIQRGSSQDDSSRQEKTILQNQTLKPSSPTDRRLVSLNHLLSTVEPAPFPIPIPTLQHHDDPHLGLVPVLGVGALVVVFPGWRGFLWLFGQLRGHPLWTCFSCSCAWLPFGHDNGGWLGSNNDVRACLSSRGRLALLSGGWCGALCTLGVMKRRKSDLIGS